MGFDNSIAQQQLQGGGFNPASEDPTSKIEQIMASLTTSEKAEAFDVMGAGSAIKYQGDQGKDARTQLYETLQNSDDQLSGKRAELLKKMAEDNPLSKSETAAMLFIGLLPSLVGKAVGGNRGGAAGAQAGTLGTTVMAKGLKEDEARKDLQNKVELAGIDEQLQSNRELGQKAKLAEIDSIDTTARDAIKNETTLQAASIRAGGEMGAAKVTAAASTEALRQQKIDALDAKKQARAKPIRVGNKIYAPGADVRDEDIKAIRDGLDSYDTFKASIKQMEGIVRSSDAQMFTNQWTNSSKLKTLREQALAELATINEIPGRGGEFLTKKYEEMLTDPTTFYNNTVARLKDPALADQLNTLGSIVEGKLDRKLQRKGFNPPIGIGRPKQDPSTGKVGYFVGYNPDGTAHYTFNEQEMLNIKERGY